MIKIHPIDLVATLTQSNIDFEIKNKSINYYWYFKIYTNHPDKIIVNPTKGLLNPSRVQTIKIKLLGKKSDFTNITVIKLVVKSTRLTAQEMDSFRFLGLKGDIFNISEKNQIESYDIPIYILKNII